MYSTSSCKTLDAYLERISLNGSGKGRRGNRSTSPRRHTFVNRNPQAFSVAPSRLPHSAPPYGGVRYTRDDRFDTLYRLSTPSLESRIAELRQQRASVDDRVQTTESAMQTIEVYNEKIQAVQEELERRANDQRLNRIIEDFNQEIRAGRVPIEVVD
jgi:hypothetical protein